MERTDFFLYDGRYHDDPFKATLFEVCATIEEARENAPDHGTNTVIVETASQRNGIRWDVIKETIVK